jgi:hypothetical protein
VADFLQGLLLHMLEAAENDPNTAHPALKGLDPSEAAEVWMRQLEAFWLGHYPFDAEMKDGNPLAWWKGFEKCPDAQILSMLAVKLFAIMVNSMADERTNSTFTWLNSPLRGRQDVQTLRDMIQIRQFYKSSPFERPKYRPTIKFHKLDTTTLKEVQEKEISDAEEDEDEEDEESRKSIALEDDDDDDNFESAFRDYEFEVDDAFDLNSAALCDLLDPNEPAPDAQPEPASPPSPVAPATKVAVKDINWMQLRSKMTRERP